MPAGARAPALLAFALLSGLWHWLVALRARCLPTIKSCESHCVLRLSQHFALHTLLAGEFDHFLQMEPDVLPVQVRFLLP